MDKILMSHLGRSCHSSSVGWKVMGSGNSSAPRPGIVALVPTSCNSQSVHDNQRDVITRDI